MLNAGWNEGSPKWRVLARNQSVLQQSVTYIPTTSGLLNSDCSVMPVMMFTADHKAETIERIVAEVKRFEAEHGHPDVKFRLATGNVGVMAATNEVVSAAQFPILVWVFGTDHPPLPRHVPLPPRDALHHHPARPRLAPRLRDHGLAEDRPEGRARSPSSPSASASASTTASTSTPASAPSTRTAYR